MNLNLLIFSFSILSIAQCYNILLVVPAPGPSHWLMFKLVIKELVNRGHHVTAITSFQYKENLENYTEILIDPPIDMNVYWNVEDQYMKRKTSDFDIVDDYFMLGMVMSRYALKNIAVQNFIKRNDLKFDLIINEHFFQECFLALKYKYQAPIIAISTFGHADTMDRAMGLLTPWSHVPHHTILDLGDDMSFYERFYNVLLSGYDAIKRHVIFLPENQRMIEEFIQPLVDAKIPSVYELEKEVSLILINNNLVLSPPRPLMPGQVNIAGAHIKPIQSLPNDLQTIFDNSEHGVIYFSLGSYMQSNKMPRDKINAILNAFSKLKQTVVWKFEDESIADLPNNVIIRKWLPQSDILAHKNVQVFISHGGLFGTTEGIYHGVPMLFIPFFTDQFRNAKQCINKGFGKQIPFSNVTTQSMFDNLIDLMTNESYRANAKKASIIFRDNINDPMETAIFWIEYVARHKGADHLKSAAVKLNWMQYLLLDVFGVLLLVLTIIALSVRKVIYLFLMARNRKTNADTQKKTL